MKKALLCLLLLLSTPGCLLHWVRHPAAKAEITKATAVPLRLFANEVLAEATIDGYTSWFFVDTGAPISAISKRLTDKISKKKFSHIHVGVGGATEGENKSRLLRFDGLQLGGVTFDKVVAVELDLSPIEEVMGLEIGGILGLSVFQDFLLTIDYPQKQLIIEQGSLPAPNQQDIIQYVLQEGHIAIPMKLSGKALQVVLDTGSNAGLDIPESEEKGLTFQAAPVISGQALGATGQTSQRSARLEGDLLFGRYTLQKPVIGMFKTTESSVGGVILKSFVLTVDQKQQRVRLSCNETTLQSPPFKSLGANLKRRAEGWEVGSVNASLPDAVLAQGDLIISINERAANELDFSALDALIQSQESLRFIVLRGKEKLEITAKVSTLVP